MGVTEASMAGTQALTMAIPLGFFIFVIFWGFFQRRPSRRREEEVSGAALRAQNPVATRGSHAARDEEEVPSASPDAEASAAPRGSHAARS